VLINDRTSRSAPACVGPVRAGTARAAVHEDHLARAGSLEDYIQANAAKLST
jgi:hypothetical protein